MSAQSSQYLPSASANIRLYLDSHNHDKWGWVVYRTTYNDNDGVWARFKEIVETRSREWIAQSDAPGIADKLEWTFVDDKAGLDGATKEESRRRHRNWKDGACRKEQPRDEKVGGSMWFGNPRYMYFVHVDEACLKSVVFDAPQPPEMDVQGVGFVKFVESDWRSMAEELDDDEDLEDEGYDEIEGCTEENVGWMRIGAYMVGVDFYEAMIGGNQTWYAFYQRPPQTVAY